MPDKNGNIISSKLHPKCDFSSALLRI